MPHTIAMKRPHLSGCVSNWESGNLRRDALMGYLKTISRVDMRQNSQVTKRNSGVTAIGTYCLWQRLREDFNLTLSFSRRRNFRDIVLKWGNFGEQKIHNRLPSLNSKLGKLLFPRGSSHNGTTHHIAWRGRKRGRGRGGKALLPPFM